jgi:hypothetical protein
MGILARRGIVLLAAVASITTACTAAPSVVNGCPEADYKPLFELSGRKYQASFRDRIGELSGYRFAHSWWPSGAGVSEIPCCCCLTHRASAASDSLAHASTLRSAARHRWVAGIGTPPSSACRLHALVRRLPRASGGGEVARTGKPVHDGQGESRAQGSAHRRLPAPQQSGRSRMPGDSAQPRGDSCIWSRD